MSTPRSTPAPMPSIPIKLPWTTNTRQDAAGARSQKVRKMAMSRRLSLHHHHQWSTPMLKAATAIISDKYEEEYAFGASRSSGRN